MKIKELAEKIGFCGCGSPDNFFIALRDRLQFCEDRTEVPFHILEQHAHGPYINKESYFIHCMLDAWELTEHGGSVYCQWLSPSGKELLEELAAINFKDPEFDIDSILYPEGED